MLKLPKQELEGEIVSRTQVATDQSPSVGASIASPSIHPPTQTIHPMPSQPQSPQKPQGFFSRVKKVKNIQIYVAIAVILVMVLIYTTSFMGGGSSSSNSNRDHVANANAFAREMEQNLSRVISGVDGVGNVNVMITVTGSPTLEIAYNVEERTVTQTGTNGQTTTTTTIVRNPILVGGNPIIIQELKPRLVGVIVVAQGAHNIGVRLNILNAVQTIVSDPDVNIEILAG